MVALSRLSRRRLVALFLLVSLVPLASLAYLAVTIAGDAASRKTQQSLTLAATVGALYVGDQLQSLEGLVDSFAHEPELTDALTADPNSPDLTAIGKTLSHLGSVRSGISAAFLLRPDGRVIDVYPYLPTVSPGTDLSARAWYQAVDARRAPYVSPVYTSAASGNPKVISIAAPVDVVGGDGTPGPLLGFLAIEYGSASIERVTQPFASAEDVTVRIADQSAVPIGQPNSDVPFAASAAYAALRGETGIMTVGGASPWLVAYAPVKPIGWAVTAQIDEARAYAAVDQLRITVVVIASALVLVLLVGAWLLDITLGHWQRAEAEIKRLAAVDSLTGLWNRRSWDSLLLREIARARRDGVPLCVAMVDLDHFKEYNDLHGHAAGDRLLTSAAESWRSTIRTTDVLARYGGEEFAIALPDCTPPNAVAIMDRLRAAMPFGSTCSAGIAAWNGEESALDLMGRADRALYAAKHAGRNRVLVADEQPPAKDAVATAA